MVPPSASACASIAIPSGHGLRWRNDDIGQVGLALASSDTEIVLTTQQTYEPDWLVTSAGEAAAAVRAVGGRVVTEPFDITVGRVAVVADPFGNTLVLLDLSKGCYVTATAGNVTAVALADSISRVNLRP